MTGSLEVSRTFLSASAFGLWPYVVLMEENDENLALPSYVFGKKGVF